MRFSSVVCGAVLASSALGASLRCFAPHRPYCCTSATSVPEIGVSLGIQCKPVPRGAKPKCSGGDVKVCCSRKAVDILGLATICELPAGLLGTVGGLLEPLTGLGGGLGAGLGAGLGVGLDGRDVEVEAEAE